MQTLSGFARKYAIMEELDSGFGAGSAPEAFVRLDSWEGRVQASLHVKGLKQGPFTYKLYLIFAKNEKLVPILAGSMSVSYSGTQNGLEIDADILKNNGLKPDMVRFAAITAESQDKKWVPLFASFEKNYRWDESIRQLLLKRMPEEESREVGTPSGKPILDQAGQPAAVRNDLSFLNPGNTPPVVPDSPAFSAPAAQGLAPNTQPVPTVSGQNISAPGAFTGEKRTEQQNPAAFRNAEPKQDEPNAAGSAPMMHQKPTAPESAHWYRCDIDKLEGLLQNNFESYVPFKRSSRGYTWYRASDLAKLSNIMYMSGINVPVFANPKILVGLFKFKHILAGLYRGDNGSSYYVIGVPAKDETDNKPFENACRWVAVSDSPVRDMGGYWLVYVSMKSGEIVV